MMQLRWRDYAPHGEAFHLARVEVRRSRASPLPHTHDFAEVFWLERGDGTHLINGRRQLLRAGDLAAIRPGDAHAFRANEATGFTLVNLAFSAATLAFLNERYPAATGRVFGDGVDLPLHLAGPAPLRRALRDAAEALARSRSRLVLDHFLLTLLLHVAPTEHGRDSGGGPPWLRKACELIREPEHFRDGTRGFVSLTGRSSEHVAREAKRHLGLTPTELVNAARLEFAARELETTTSGINEISLECGFQSLAHFYSLFREHYGTTPRRYRLGHQSIIGE